MILSHFNEYDLFGIKAISAARRVESRPIPYITSSKFFCTDIDRASPIMSAP